MRELFGLLLDNGGSRWYFLVLFVDLSVAGWASALGLLMRRRQTAWENVACFLLLTTFACEPTHLIMRIFSFGLIDLVTTVSAWTSHMHRVTTHVLALDVALYHLSLGTWNYWVHRLFHTRWLWPIHRVHHELDELDVFAAWRQHPLERASIALASCLAFAGGDPLAAIIVTAVGHVSNALAHLSVSWSLGPLQWVLFTPRAHRLHHSADPKHVDKNFSFGFIDWVFGTWCDGAPGVVGIGTAPKALWRSLLTAPWEALAIVVDSVRGYGGSVKRWLLLAALALVMAPSRAIGGKPEQVQGATDWTRISAPVWGRMQILRSATATYPIQADTAAATHPPAACFGWGTRVAVSTASVATCCFTTSSSVTIGAQRSDLAAYVTDSGGTNGLGACFGLQPSEKYQVWPLYRSLIATGVPGARTGICSASQAPVIDPTHPVRPLCAVNNDCVYAGVSAGTCSTAGTQANYDLKVALGCAFLVCRGRYAFTQITVGIER